jgi:hypothetical protein
MRAASISAARHVDRCGQGVRVPARRSATRFCKRIRATEVRVSATKRRAPTQRRRVRRSQQAVRCRCSNRACSRARRWRVAKRAAGQARMARERPKRAQDSLLLSTGAAARARSCQRGGASTARCAAAAACNNVCALAVQRAPHARRSRAPAVLFRSLPRAASGTASGRAHSDSSAEGGGDLHSKRKGPKGDKRRGHEAMEMRVPIGAPSPAAVLSGARQRTCKRRCRRCGR